ncbi:MAG: TonB-dependent receptor [Gilvibacter sp.]
MRKLLIIMLLLPMMVSAQEQITGKIIDAAVEDSEMGLAGATVAWLNSELGAIADLDGNFSLPYKPEYGSLVFSYVGYATDTIAITSNRFITHRLSPNANLEAVTISVKQKASARSTIKAQNIIMVSSDELLKAACCNLSESFETNPSIDVNFADAITGTRQIKMLGLKSPNLLITTENVPSIRGAAQTYGLSFIPGTWVESIQITKGAGSVTNGFESIAGQINAELQKPSKDKKLFVNLYAGLNARLEANVHLNTKVGQKWHTGLYVHANRRDKKFDKNNDSFLDVPLQDQINVMNRWQYTDTENGVVSFFNVRFLNDQKQTGQFDFNPDSDRGTTSAWGSEIDTQRFDSSFKLGWVNANLPWQSLGVQAAYSYHNQESYFGLNTYDITHNSFYGNVIYNSIISDSRHKIKTGVSVTLDTYDELVNTNVYERKENSVGGFFEYAFDNLDDLTLTAGIRADNHNKLGFFVSPRLHARYSVWEDGTLRFSVGRGKRSANIFTENQQLFSTSRTINVRNEGGEIYGLDPESAWNYGLSFMQSFNLFERKASVVFDFYRTDFTNQVVVDWENPFEVSFYNLQGKSYANSFQLEVNTELAERLELRAAYKYYDVKTDYDSGRLERPLTANHRIFGNLGYETLAKDNGGQWKFDLTYNWLSSVRYPSTDLSPVAFKRPDRSPTIGTLNGQVTKVFSKSFEVYLGGENITNQRQSDPVISADNPFGPNFDSTFVYGPIFGSMYYAGLRYNLN